MVSIKRSGKTARKRQREANKPYDKLPLGEQARRLEDPEYLKVIDAQVAKHERKRLEGLRKRIQALVCSAAWFDANWHHKEAYPPGGDQTLMKPCKSERCKGRLYPPQAIGSRGFCWDCAYCAMSKYELANVPSSTSAINLGKIRAAIRRGQQPVGGV